LIGPNISGIQGAIACLGTHEYWSCIFIEITVVLSFQTETGGDLFLNVDARSDLMITGTVEWMLR